jgi:hypothetical protein
MTERRLLVRVRNVARPSARHAPPGRARHYLNRAGSPGLPVGFAIRLECPGRYCSGACAGARGAFERLSVSYCPVSAVMRKASAERGAAARATDHDLRLTRIKANVSDVLEPGGDRLAVGDHIHSYSVAHRLTD